MGLFKGESDRCVQSTTLERVFNWEGLFNWGSAAKKRAFQGPVKCVAGDPKVLTEVIWGNLGLSKTGGNSRGAP